MEKGEKIAHDAIEYAAQLGRLDFVSAILAAIALLLVFAGIYAFIDFRKIAKARAEEVAKAVAKETAEREANLYLQKEMPNLFREYIEFMDGVPDDGDPDDIAGAQDNEQ